MSCIRIRNLNPTKHMIRYIFRFFTLRAEIKRLIIKTTNHEISLREYFCPSVVEYRFLVMYYLIRIPEKVLKFV